ncbi:unnamed protein product [Lactuca virosa]|uniref:Uncharacterized protein n=1 Tax=Lactuca virosa TaxID=75947 RepID=A0AAU9MMB5_9ASTR|nr:unnamed protein product [Lactuca virosa]
MRIVASVRSGEKLRLRNEAYCGQHWNQWNCFGLFHKIHISVHRRRRRNAHAKDKPSTKCDCLILLRKKETEIVGLKYR